MIRDQTITHPIPVTKITARCVNRATKKLFTKETTVYGSRLTRDQELELARKNLNTSTDMVLNIIKEENGTAYMSMTVDEFKTLSTLTQTEEIKQ